MFQLSKHAAQQVSRTVSRVERASRSVRPHRRRSPPSSPPPLMAIGSLTATLNHGGSAGFTFSIGGVGSSTCYDALLCTGDSIASGATVVVAKIAGKWYAIQTACGC